MVWVEYCWESDASAPGQSVSFSLFSMLENCRKTWGSLKYGTHLAHGVCSVLSESLYELLFKMLGLLVCLRIVSGSKEVSKTQYPA